MNVLYLCTDTGHQAVIRSYLLPANKKKINIEKLMLEHTPNIKGWRYMTPEEIKEYHEHL